MTNRLAVLMLSLLAFPALAAKTELVSEFMDRQAQGGITNASCISGDGSVIGFHSEATNLASGDTNAVGDLFIISTGQDTQRVNVSPGGEQANAALDVGSSTTVFSNTNSACSLSADGGKIAFATRATNLVTNDGGGSNVDVFVRDIAAGVNIKVTSAGNDDSRQPAISGDGEVVVFTSAATNLDNDCNVRAINVYRADISNPSNISIKCISVRGTPELDVSTTTEPDISADGRFAVFDSNSTNLVIGDSNQKRDVFLYDHDQDSLRRISVSTAGAQGNLASDRPVISADGNFIAFVSAADNLVPNDTNDSNPDPDFSFGIDVFVYNRVENKLDATRVNVSSSEAQAIPLNEAGSAPGIDPSISDDGRFVAFVSTASNLIGNDNNGRRDVFLRDRVLGLTQLISQSSGNVIGNNRSFRPAIAGSGLLVVFDSIATNLIGSDTNGTFDAFSRSDFPTEGELYLDSFEDN